jgi:hypothetical protein
MVGVNSRYAPRPRAAGTAKRDGAWLKFSTYEFEGEETSSTVVDDIIGRATKTL